MHDQIPNCAGSVLLVLDNSRDAFRRGICLRKRLSTSLTSKATYSKTPASFLVRRPLPRDLLLARTSNRNSSSDRNVDASLFVKPQIFSPPLLPAVNELNIEFPYYIGNEFMHFAH